MLFQALSELARKLEQRKFAATDQPRHGRHAKPESRHIPAEVRRAVWERDGGRCTFTSDDGHRCEERKDVQFDHIDPYARGGEATVSGIRLLCRAHNQMAWSGWPLQVTWLPFGTGPQTLNTRLRAHSQEASRGVCWHRPAQGAKPDLCVA